VSSNPREKIVEVARRFVGIRETSKNRFPGDVKLWDSTTYADGWKNREPYCAAFVCHVVRLADLEELVMDFRPRPQSPSVSEWRNWVRRADSGVYIFKDASEAQAGDIVSLLPHVSHIGIVAGALWSNGKLPTIEANTDADGGREGDGIYEKTRTPGICGEFYRLPCRAIPA